MDQPNNPAGRLHAFLSETMKIAGGKPGAHAMRTVLGVKENDHSGLLRYLSFVWELPGEVERRIRRIEDLEHGTYLSWKPNVMGAFTNLNLQGRIQDFQTQIKPEDLARLEFCDERLSRKMPDNPMDEEALAGLLEDVSSLIGEVVDADIDHQLKEYVLRRLDAIERAIQAHKYAGTQPLREAVDAALGNIVFNREIARKVGENPTTSRLWKVLGRAAICLNLITGPTQLESMVKGMLPRPGPEIAEVAIDDDQSESAPHGELVTEDSDDPAQ
jgi:hypothetical protein